jgi:two-component system OmpR family sensor kinase
LVDSASTVKVENMLAEVQRSSAVFDWEFSLSLNGQAVPIHAAAGQMAEGLLIVGSLSRSDMSSCYEEILLINNEQTNELHKLMKDRATTPNNEIYEQMTQLNNELATAQRKMAKQNARLERLNEQKNQFLGMAAHDMRNPLGVVATYSELLLEELTDAIGTEHRSFLQHIHTSSTFMLGMVNELLDISKIESGNLELALAPVDLREFLTRIVMLNRVFAERKQIEIEFTMPDELPPSPLDEPKIEQVFNNLLSNACQYSHPHTTIRVSAQRRDNEAIITIQDQGQGIPSEELAQIFEPFHKTSVKSTEDEPSTGLGLAIVRRIVEGHGSKIQVESAVGEGTTFSFSLPLAVDQPTADKPKPTATGPWRILLAEDNTFYQQMMSSILTKRHHQVTLFTDGRAALDLLAEQHFDVILIDLEMPVMGGLETIQKLRQRETGRRTPAIALTGHSHDQERQSCLEVGIDDFLTKPVKPELLIAIIAQAISNS